MMEPTKEQRQLAKMLKDIEPNDNTFFTVVMAFAMQTEAEQMFIDAIEDGVFEEVQDFYDLIALYAENNIE